MEIVKTIYIVILIALLIIVAFKYRIMVQENKELKSQIEKLEKSNQKGEQK